MAVLAGENFNDVAAFELGAQGNQFAVYLGSRGMQTYFGVDGEGEIHRRRVAGKFDDFALGSEDEYFILIKVHLEVLHEFPAIARFRIELVYIVEKRQVFVVPG